MQRFLPTLFVLLAAVVLLSASVTAVAFADDAPSDKPSTDTRDTLAPPGECARPRGLVDAARPSSFDIAGSPAARLVPAQVSSTLTAAGPPPVPPPSSAGPPSPSLCDEPMGCSAGGPAFIESEPVPGLPPGARP